MAEISVIYNARLVDSRLDSRGAIVIVDKLIRSVYLGDCASQKDAERIAQAALSDAELGSGVHYVDAAQKTLMPAFIDMHVHFRYPGQTQKEDLDTGLRAAVAGGVGTVVLMPNTKPVVSTEELALKVQAEAKKRGLSRVFQTISITKDFKGEDTSELENISSKSIPVITEDGNDVASAAVMTEAMTKAGKAGIIVSCHCEDHSLRELARPYRSRALGFMKQYNIPADQWTYSAKEVPSSVEFEIDGNLRAANHYLAMAEDIATERNITIAENAGCHIHIAHCSTAKSLDAVRRAKQLIASGKAPAGFNVTVEVTPHHLSLCGTEAPLLRALVNPPLRSEADRRALIDGIKDGTVDVISTDHAPHTSEDKAAGSPGFTGLETSFAVCHTVLCYRESLPLSRLSELMSARPAELLYLNSGTLEVGRNADLVLVDPTERWTVDSSRFFSKGKATPQNGQELIGRVHKTFIGGKEVFSL